MLISTGFTLDLVWGKYYYSTIYINSTRDKKRLIFIKYVHTYVGVYSVLII